MLDLPILCMLAVLDATCVSLLTVSTLARITTAPIYPKYPFKRWCSWNRYSLAKELALPLRTRHPHWHCQFMTIFQRGERVGQRGELDCGSTVSVLPKLTRVDTWLLAGGAVGVVVEP